jgi:hypothetical protein
VIEIAFEGAASRRGETKFGFGQTAIERFVAFEIASFFELARVDAQVAVCCVQKSFKFIESERIIYGKRTNDAEANAFVNQAIEIWRDAFRISAHAFEMRRIGAGFRVTIAEWFCFAQVISFQPP